MNRPLESADGFVVIPQCLPSQVWELKEGGEIKEYEVGWMCCSCGPHQSFLCKPLLPVLNLRESISGDNQVTRSESLKLDCFVAGWLIVDKNEETNQ